MNTLRYLLYGSSVYAPDDLRVELEAALGVDFEPRHSEYHCGDYCRAGDLRGEHYVLEANWRDDDGLLLEPDHEEFDLIFEVNNTARPAEVRSLLADVSGLVFIAER
ncbi:hypothetical protein [Amycolatopsis granulosa]|uniref:hypothetical protein n=1 Tax=Amycolatopsis granulosa TaxID=185684 RepID=UPI0014246856|nr:hypothetical protein [Amycolatopsis granulosa]NIH87696.1 hypothetical protein [Amycolatopsis granulosa]